MWPRRQDHPTVIQREVDLDSGAEAGDITQWLGDHDLALGPHSMSHTK
jgi:hypothetical protein